MKDLQEKPVQLSFFSAQQFPSFPSTRYQGSKAKLIEWIWQNIAHLEFHTFLDAFGGTGVVAYQAKMAGKRVTYNDLLKFNYYFGLALIENKQEILSSEDVDWLLAEHTGIPYRSFVRDTFHDIYFTDEENAWIDRTIANIYNLEDRYKFALAFFALCQACIVKRPYNLFHRKNLYIRLAEVERSFGNKQSWDRPFEEWFRRFVEEANQAVFENGEDNHAIQYDALEIPGQYDLVYIDTPYISNKGVGVDYRDFYHFLEGLTNYYAWEDLIDHKSKHRRLIPETSPWHNCNEITAAFDRLFYKFKDSKIVVSYRSDGIPSEEQLVELLKRYKSSVSVEHYGQYIYVLSKNNESKEILLIAE